MQHCRWLAVLAGLLLLGCGSSSKHEQTTEPATCGGDSPDCKVSKATLEQRDEMRKQQEQQRRADRRAKERELMSRKDMK